MAPSEQQTRWRYAHDTWREQEKAQEGGTWAGAGEGERRRVSTVVYVCLGVFPPPLSPSFFFFFFFLPPPRSHLPFPPSFSSSFDLLFHTTQKDVKTIFFGGKMFERIYLMYLSIRSLTRLRTPLSISKRLKITFCFDFFTREIPAQNSIPITYIKDEKI